MPARNASRSEAGGSTNSALPTGRQALRQLQLKL